MTEKEIFELAHSIYNYISGSADDADIQRINVWVKASESNIRLLEKFSGDEFVDDILAELRLFDAQKAYENFIRRKWNMTLRRRMRNIAAVLIPLIAVGGSLLLMQERHHPLTYNPSGNAVVLTLSDNQEVALNDLNTSELHDKGQVFANYGESISYAEPESRPQTDLNRPEPIFHTLTVPRGKEYTIILSDGSSVKLNAMSKLKYPVPFGENQREVTISGEAYFRVSPDADRPFIVKTDKYDILVTGTEFNVRSYAEDQTATTLVSGSVRIEKDNMVYELSPGQQAVDAAGKIRIDNVNIASYVAWERSEFLFAQKPLSYIISEISNWYDIQEVIFEEEEAKNLIFSAGFRKSKPLEEILETLEATGIIKFKYSHGKIKISYSQK